MEDNTTIFWDKKINTEEAKRILKDEHNPRFIEFASLLLARSNKPKRIFANYLSKELFVENWINIKRRMRDNKWNDRRIIFWDEIYKAVRKNINIKEVREPKVRPLDIDPEIKIICDKMKDYRKKSGLTQIELAKKTGLSQQSISFAEQGYINISLRTLKKIADALNLRIVLENKNRPIIQP
jgi:DNA-binding XRE family transcriptional regulator